ncbi:helix-turn-helix domain-containing protein [Streptomyces sp. NPDC001667]
MPRWRALPEELDPQVGEFTEQLRRLVERSGLGLGALADRTGYSKTSWERYLNGRLLPPLGAAEALADVTGADVGHLSTMWELAERAWSRSELRHDVTMEAVRIAQARSALGEFGPPARPAKPAPPLCREAPEPRAPSVPRSPGPPDYRAKAIPVGQRPRRRAALFVTGVVGALLVVAAAALLLGAGGGDKHKGAQTPPATTPAAVASTDLPAGVKCAGDSCAGKDPEAMGCGGARATTAGSATVGTSYVEVRYSEVCRAAWGRITQAASGDAIRINARPSASSPARTEAGRVGATPGHTADGYTPMVTVSAPDQATACATLLAGARGCTKPVR